MLGNIIPADLGAIVAGLTLLIWGADRFVYGASAIARNMGIAPLMIGLTVVAFATSAPEILVSIIAALQGEPGLAFGNAIGSNIVNIGLVLGVTAMVRPIPLESDTLRREMPALLAVSLLTVSLFHQEGFRGRDSGQRQHENCNHVAVNRTRRTVDRC
jgi:cation:H+ antiporter